MFARMATFDGLEPNQIDDMLSEIERRTEGGQPEGIPSVEALFLVDRNNGQLTALSLYDTEEDRQTGDTTLRQMTPPVAELQSPNVRMYEVALRRP